MTDYSAGLDGLPPSDVLKLQLGADCSAVVRPRGTEPKLKLYTSVRADAPERAETLERAITEAVEHEMLRLR